MSDLLLPARDVPILSFAEKERRARKITVGEAEDVLSAFAQSMLNRFGPLAIEMRGLEFRVSRIEKGTTQNAVGGDIE